MLKTARRDEERVGVKGLPVLDDSGKMAGFLSIGDILNAVFPPYMEGMDIGHFAWNGMAETIAKRVKGKLVSDLMTRKVVSVHEDASLMECVDHMHKSGVKRLPVVDAEGRVKGIVYERDVFLAITKIMLEEDK